mmetsp:Transcript_36621/g.77856  ORF Transcript_36621/g.77856 Transcript_36621/m.77856 type:complete len:315 (-) Transcript_36621:110-1054(-)|eukprot:CAMPEP_0206433990 /NCGR_PEP_ID=MMETSP0324_2-20121206/8857_1 /ASSEMBLY_ACC=CAM_ASM_000836 /TAXON_ID=2866 /ORGANISM="Crypthecodinium cohnii, Strain Seligo" /LENGTH=314 /DNA_ID=CAMNT_0053900351 /DNA_START=44 /DNA_END=988 /DNA_ORIENTATION=-
MAIDALPATILAVFGAVFVFIALSITSLNPTEMALVQNHVLSTVNPVVLDTPGLQFVGFWNSLMVYPKTIETMEFTAEHRGLLDGRTRDGLPLVLGLAFQYRLLPDKLFELYTSFEKEYGDYQKVFRLVASHIVTEEATKWTAYQFFNEKQAIAGVMREKLDLYFQANLCATVESLQINEDDLPEAFTETILAAATSKQNITRMEKTRDAKVVEFKTSELVAEAQANVTLQKAEGDKARILQNGHADAAIIDAFVEAELQAYGKVHDELGLEGQELLQYIWYDTLSGGSVSADSTQEKDVQLMFGVNPSTYIAG